MKKTPIQKLIERLEKRSEQEWNVDEILDFQEAIHIAKSLLPYEREVIEEVYHDGCMEGANDDDLFDAPYYERTFNTDESPLNQPNTPDEGVNDQ
jgi:hypothetical protein